MDFKRAPSAITTQDELGQPYHATRDEKTKQTDQLFLTAFFKGCRASNDLSVTSEDKLDILLRHVKESCKSETGL